MEAQLNSTLRKILLVLSCFMLAIGNCGGPIIMRLYFVKGGKRVWLSSWLETGGWPITFIPLTISYFHRRKTEGPNTKLIQMKCPVFIATAVIGLLTGLDDYLYAYGFARLPVSTATIIVATHLGFTAFFAFLLVKQKFTAYSVNAIVLLSVGSGVLAMHTSSDRPKEFSSTYQLGPPIFDGTNYQMWAVRMEAYLGGNDLWEAVEDDYEVLPLPNNPTVAQMKHHNERRQRKSKARASLYAAVTSTIFTRIMTLKTAHEIWNFLKKEYEGDEKIKGMRVLNLIREFEMQKMKDSETIKVYSDRLLDIVNKVRLLGTDFSDSRIVQKILVTIPEKYEATIAALENLKDMSSITLAELLNALQAQEQRRLMRQEGSVEGAFQAISQYNNRGKN